MKTENRNFYYRTLFKEVENINDYAFILHNLTKVILANAIESATEGIYKII